MYRFKCIAIVLLLLPMVAWGQDTAIQVEQDPDDPKHLNVFVGPVLEEAERQATQEAVALESLQRQMDAMATTLSQLQETLDYLVNQVIADLEAENADLYRELQRVYMHLEARGSAAGEANVPRPGGERIQAVLDRLRGVEEEPEEVEVVAEASAMGSAEDAPEPEPASQPVAPPFTWEILDEWGRSPEVVAELGKNVTSLKGMICHVTPGASAGDIKDLGRSLRLQYADYDNINIEIFDDKAAAEAYIKHRTANPAHQVLSIAKHLRSERDVILYYDNGIPVNVAF